MIEKPQKFIFGTLFFLLLLNTICLGDKIEKIRHNNSEEKIRIVFDIPENAVYSYKMDDKKIIIDFENSTFDNNLQNYKILHGFIEGFEINNSIESSQAVIQTRTNTETKIFYLKDPPRLVVDIFVKPSVENSTWENTSLEANNEVISGIENELTHTNNIANGISLFDIEEVVHDTILTGKALLVNPKTNNIMPVFATNALQKKENFNPLENIIAFFGFGGEHQLKLSHFAKRTVSQFLKMYDGTAAINGSFFFADGTPVGTLIIKRQIISSPLYNRTSLIINSDGSAYIAPVKMRGYIKLKNGEKIDIAGINQPIKNNIIIYTPDYQKTGYDKNSINIVVENQVVKSISYSETSIPQNGFVISAPLSKKQFLESKIKISDTVQWYFMTNPPLSNMMHIISGGPRLLYDGKSCITAKEENFKSDVAKSRANRTAVGIKKNGDVILLTVEKATLKELARLLLKVGAYNAMNLDGGGSSSMVVKNSRIFGGNRPVSNALVINPKSF